MKNTVRGIAVATVAAASLVMGVQTSHAAPDLRSGTVLVLGDSITARYTDDPGDPMQGWWSRLADQRSLYPVISAQGGGGLVKKGNGCDGTTLRERTPAVVNRVRPDEIWIAIGKNDTTVCKHGKAVRVSATYRQRAATAYFRALANQAESMGINLANVYVTVPWGTAAIHHRRAIVTAYASAARAAGLRFVNVPRMARSLTKDGTHPNNRGSAYLATTFGGHMVSHVGPVDTEPPADEVVE